MSTVAATLCVYAYSSLVSSETFAKLCGDLAIPLTFWATIREVGPYAAILIVPIMAMRHTETLRITCKLAVALLVAAVVFMATAGSAHDCYSGGGITDEYAGEAFAIVLAYVIVAPVSYLVLFFDLANFGVTKYLKSKGYRP